MPSLLYAYRRKEDVKGIIYRNGFILVRIIGLS